MIVSLRYLINSLSYIFNRFVLNKEYLVGYSEKFNLRVKFKTEDGGGRHIYKRSTYENDISEFLAYNLNLRKGDTFLDVGANIGWYSLLISSFYPETNIFSFEPDPINIYCLKYNRNINQAFQISIVEKAISNKCEKQQFYLYKNSNRGRNSLLPINDYKVITVDGITLDEFVKKNNIEKIRMIKMDIEGFEYFALKGASEILPQVELLLMEFAPNYMRKGGVDPANLSDIINKNNFLPCILKNKQLQPVTYDWLNRRQENINVFLLKPDQKIIPSQYIKKG